MECNTCHRAVIFGLGLSFHQVFNINRMLKPNMFGIVDIVVLMMHASIAHTHTLTSKRRLNASHKCEYVLEELKEKYTQ